MIYWSIRSCYEWIKAFIGWYCFLYDILVAAEETNEKPKKETVVCKNLRNTILKILHKEILSAVLLLVNHSLSRNRVETGDWEKLLLYAGLIRILKIDHSVLLLDCWNICYIFCLYMILYAVILCCCFKKWIKNVYIGNSARLALLSRCSFQLFIYY